MRSTDGDGGGGITSAFGARRGMSENGGGNELGISCGSITCVDIDGTSGTAAAGMKPTILNAHGNLLGNAACTPVTPCVRVCTLARAQVPRSDRSTNIPLLLLSKLCNSTSGFGRMRTAERRNPNATSPSYG